MEPTATNRGTDILLAVLVLVIALSVVGSLIGSGGSLGPYGTLLEWWYAKDWNRILLIPMLIFTFFDFLLIGFAAFILRRYARLTSSTPKEELVKPTSIPKDEIHKDWKEIRDLANSTAPSDWNMAIIRADGLLDEVLQRLGYEGTTMADRLKIVDPTKLPSLDRIWSAHRLRNTIVHGPSVEYTRESLTHTLHVYEEGLKELGMLTEEEKRG